jgi:phosphomannomutase
MQKKIMFFDVDDTVCPSTQPVSQEMAQQLNRLIGEGRILAFISGSTAEDLFGQLGSRLEGEYHLLGTSGTKYVKVTRGEREEVYNHALSEEQRSRILGLLRGLASRHQVHSLTTEEDQIQDRGSQLTFSALGRHAPDAAKRAFDPGKSLRSAWVAELRKDLGEEFHIGIGGTTSVDITRAGQDKGWGVREFLNFHHWDAAHAVFYGDNLQEGGNDFPARSVVDCVAVTGVDDTLKKLRALEALPPSKGG